MQSYNPAIPGCTFSRIIELLAKHVNNKNTGKPRVLAINALLHSLLTFNNDRKPPPKWILWEFGGSRIRPQLGGLPTLKRLHGKIWPRLGGLPSLADRATRLGGSPHLSCKCNQIKMRGYMDRRVTPAKRITSLTWGPPPPCINRPN